MDRYTLLLSEYHLLDVLDRLCTKDYLILGQMEEDVDVGEASLLVNVLEYLYADIHMILIFRRLFLLEEKDILLVKFCYSPLSWELKKMVWLSSCFEVCQCVTLLRINGNLLKTLSCVEERLQWQVCPHYLSFSFTITWSIMNFWTK